MSEKVIRENWVARQAKEVVEVPSWEEFCGERDNKGYLWWVVNQLKSNPSGDEDPAVAVRKIYDDIRNLEQQCRTFLNDIQQNRGSLDALETKESNHINALNKRLDTLPDDPRLLDSVREAVRDVLEPLCNPVVANIDHICKDNSDFSARLNAFEAQLRELPDKANEDLLKSILAEIQPLLDTKADIASLQSANEELKTGISSLHAELSSWQANLNQRLASSHEANSSLKQEIDSIRAELSSCQIGLKQELASTQEAISNLKKENDSLCAELSICQASLDALLNPPKKQGFFKRLSSKIVKLFPKKTLADTTTPPLQGSNPCP